MNTLSPRLRRHLSLLLICTALLFNVFSLSFFTVDGRVDGIRRDYIWFLDLYLVALAALCLVGSAPATRLLQGLLVLMTALACLEVPSALAWKLTHSQWHFRSSEIGLFERHPYLVGVPKPSITAVNKGLKREKLIRHNSHGLRGDEFDLKKPPGTDRIVVIGGSSTYCVGVSNGETWPELLDEQLQRDVEVLNLGVPGYSSVEHVIQTALLLSNLDADIVIYYIGWNDLRSMHVANLRPDYSAFHGRAQYDYLGLPRVWQGRKLAIVEQGVSLLQQAGWVYKTPSQTKVLEGEVASSIDPRALSLYLRNVSSLIVLARELGVTPVFVPQVMNYARLSRGLPYGWFPFIRTEDVERLLGEYNQALRELTGQKRALFVEEVLVEDWSEGDFIDMGHFSPKGNRRFSEILAHFIEDNRLVDSRQAVNRARRRGAG